MTYLECWKLFLDVGIVVSIFFYIHSLPPNIY